MSKASEDRLLRDSPVLDPEIHARLLGEVDAYAQRAGIHRWMIGTPLVDMATETEVEWVRSVPDRLESGPYGLFYEGRVGKPPIEDRMMACAAACLRNFIDARVVPLHRLLDERVNATVLMIPNFSTAAQEGGYLPYWKKSLLLDVLYSRFLDQKITVLWVEDGGQMEKEFGEQFWRFLREHYTKVEG